MFSIPFLCRKCNRSKKIHLYYDCCYCICCHLQQRKDQLGTTILLLFVFHLSKWVYKRKYCRRRGTLVPARDINIWMTFGNWTVRQTNRCLRVSTVSVKLLSPVRRERDHMPFFCVLIVYVGRENAYGGKLFSNWQNFLFTDSYCLALFHTMRDNDSKHIFS